MRHSCCMNNRIAPGCTAEKSCLRTGVRSHACLDSAAEQALGAQQIMGSRWSEIVFSLGPRPEPGIVAMMTPT